jgi:hypothetical protein
MEPRFLLEDVQTCSRDRAVLEGGDQGRLIDNRSSRCVDQDGAAPHLREFTSADQMSRFWREGHMKGEDIRFGKQRR